MKTHLGFPGNTFTQTIAVLALAALACGCGRGPATVQRVTQSKAVAMADPLSIVLGPHAGDARIDVEIRDRQQQVRAGVNVAAEIERLGWLYVAKARSTFEDRFYKIAEQCADALDARQAGSPEALLLRGHALHSQHRFRDAETIALQLVRQRGLAFDFGLLGDVLVDIGYVDEAAVAYQRMLDIKPDPQGYARAAHVRWLKGDFDGAIELARMAARGSSPRDPESAAWMNTQLARYLWQANRDDETARAIEIALGFHSNYPPALLLRGRIALGNSDADSAVEDLRIAVKANPLPEYQWVLAEALRESGADQEAKLILSELTRTGACSDPRTCAVFLATRGTDPNSAVTLARAELESRRDVFTYDALAWALAAAGNLDEARANLSRALSLGTQDPRLAFHAAMISFKSGETEKARHWFAKTSERFLLPSEVAQLRATIAVIQNNPAADSVAAR